MALTFAPASAKPALGHLAFNLAAITIVLALGGLALAYALDGARREHRLQQPDEVEGSVTRTVAGKEMTVPRALLRYDEQGSTGFSEEVDLRVMLPLGPGGADRPVDVTLIPRSQARPSSALLDGVYLHQFTLTEVSGPVGLIGKPLSGTDGYEGETVWYDALSPNPFVAKCEAPVPGATIGRCIRTVFFNEVAVVYAFDSDVLENWRKFDVDADKALVSIGLTRPK